MQIADILDRGAIAPRLNAPNKRQCLTLVAELAARSLGLQAAGLVDALAEREALGSTGVGGGVGLPHARVPGLDRVRGVFLRLEHPVAFDAIDEQPVDLVFGLFAPPAAGVEHLRALAKVSRLLRQPQLREQLRKAETADAIHALLLRYEGQPAPI